MTYSTFNSQFGLCWKNVSFFFPGIFILYVDFFLQCCLASALDVNYICPFFSYYRDTRGCIKDIKVEHATQTSQKIDQYESLLKWNSRLDLFIYCFLFLFKPNYFIWLFFVKILLPKPLLQQFLPQSGINLCKNLFWESHDANDRPYLSVTSLCVFFVW